ncbi:MAG: L-ribulose-5-phosphate 4-epimerase [Christensenellales bacterium]|jgi:L-ribulose-5-phosphate 4-epimerase
MLEALKETVYRANMLLPRYGLVTFTWGNVSAVDRASGVIVIKPSGVAYESMRAEQMVVVRLEDGKVLEGNLRPSSDTPTHLELYRRFPNIGGVAHTHSSYAASFAQAEEDIPCMGTTHADYFYGSVPCTRHLTSEEILGDYEHNTGLVIAETFKARGIDPDATPAVLVRKHGPFTWGKDALKAVECAVVLEELAKMTLFTRQISPDVQPASKDISDKHYFRKHGKGAYYGQNA